MRMIVRDCVEKKPLVGHLPIQGKCSYLRHFPLLLNQIHLSFSILSSNNCQLSDLDVRFSDNLDDINSDSDWDLFRQFNDFQCSTGTGGGGNGGT